MLIVSGIVGHIGLVHHLLHLIFEIGFCAPRNNVRSEEKERESGRGRKENLDNSKMCVIFI